MIAGLPSEAPMPAAITRRQIRLRGIVQGIGFRPFVYQLAHRLQLHGHVRNTADGVLMEVEGAPRTIDQFLREMAHEHPPFARIEETLVTELAPTGEPGFVLRQSLDEKSQFALVSPDLATCEDCRRDFSDPRNRRFGYPFTNCMRAAIQHHSRHPLRPADDHDGPLPHVPHVPGRV